MEKDLGEKISKFEGRISDRKWNPKTVGHYILWAKGLEKWMDPMGLESREAVMFDFDTYLAELPEDSPWNGGKGQGDEFSHRSRIQALSAAKLYLQLMHGARLDRDFDEFVSGEEPEFEPDWYYKEEAEEVFEKTRSCIYPHCHAMTKLVMIVSSVARSWFKHVKKMWIFRKGPWKFGRSSDPFRERCSSAVKPPSF